MSEYGNCYNICDFCKYQKCCKLKFIESTECIITKEKEPKYIRCKDYKPSLILFGDEIPNNRIKIALLRLTAILMSLTALIVVIATS